LFTKRNAAFQQLCLSKVGVWKRNGLVLAYYGYCQWCTCGYWRLALGPEVLGQSRSETTVVLAVSHWPNASQGSRVVV
jgi:hypothetical protein